MTANFQVDPVSAAVIQAGLQAASDEMFAILRKTAMSPIIYEVLDVGTGVLDGDGSLVSSGAGIPTFVGILDKAAKRLLELHAPESIRPGDVFITNDPGYGGVTHLNDVALLQPVFFAGRRVAWTATIAHWNDVGGMTPGSMAVDAVEIFQEGLRLPGVKLFDSGQMIEPVFETILANSRLPEFVQGDLWAQVAACGKAASRIERLVETHGLNAYTSAVENLFASGEKRALAGLGKLEPGSYEIEQEQDDGARWRARIEITAQTFTVDLRDNPEQREAPHNTSRDGAVISSQMIFKALTDPELFANEGSFRPLQVVTRKGTIFHATGPAPHGFYFETRICLFDMLWKCMAQAMPERLPAGHFASICGTVVAGIHPDTGRRFTMVEPQMGGWGATATRDGLDAMYSASHGETYNCPAEICEARYGIDVLWRRLNESDEENGRHSGGKGLSICLAPRGKVSVTAGYSHSQIATWGSSGGSEGGKNSFSVESADGSCEAFAFVSGKEVDENERLHITTARGGGWGGSR